MLRYCEGSWRAVVGPRVAVLLAELPHPYDSIWSLVRDAAQVSDVVDAASLQEWGHGAYAVISRHDQRDLCVRGGVAAATRPPGSDDDDWHELEPTEGVRSLEPGWGVRLTAQPLSDVWWPLQQGIVLAGALSIDPSPAERGEFTSPSTGPATEDTQVLAYDLLFDGLGQTDPEGAAVRPSRQPAPSDPALPDPPVEGDDLPAPAAQLRLVLPSGEGVAVDRVLLLGRAPLPPPTSSVQTRLVPLGDQLDDVSRTHLEIRPAADGSVVVTDLASTNGTILSRPGSGDEALEAGVPTSLSVGCVLDLAGQARIDVIATA